MRRLVARKLPSGLVPLEERRALVQGLIRLPCGVRSIAGETHQLDSASDIRGADASRTRRFDLIAVRDAIRPVIEQQVEKLPTSTIGAFLGNGRAHTLRMIFDCADGGPELMSILGKVLDRKRGARIDPAAIVVEQSNDIVPRDRTGRHGKRYEALIRILGTAQISPGHGIERALQQRRRKCTLCETPILSITSRARREDGAHDALTSQLLERRVNIALELTGLGSPYAAVLHLDTKMQQINRIRPKGGIQLRKKARKEFII